MINGDGSSKDGKVFIMKYLLRRSVSMRDSPRNQANIPEIYI